MKILTIIFFILFAYCALSLATIIKNGVSLTDEPGMLIRLKTFLSTHKAETANDALFNELKTPIYETLVEDALATIKELAKNNAWSLELTGEASTKSDELTLNKLHFVSTTQLMNFKDDVLITVESINTNQVAIHITSESRVGRADFGANLGRVTQLISELDKQLKRSN